MKCDKFSELITLYVGGELTLQEVALVENHIYSCKPCAEEVEEYRAISNKLAMLKEEPRPDGFWEDMWFGIKEGIARERKVLKFDTLLKYAAMLLLGLGVGFFGYMLNNKQEIDSKSTLQPTTPLNRFAYSENATANRWLLPDSEPCPVDSKLGVAVSNAPEGGIQIKGIVEGSPAQNLLQLQPNDIVIKFDEELIKDLASLQKVAEQITKTGKINMTLTVVRNGEVINLNIGGDFNQKNK